MCRKSFIYVPRDIFVILQIAGLNQELWDSDYDWRFNAEPSGQYSRATINGDLWPRGKMLGGSAGINAMVYLRGFPRDYNNWEAMGNTNWGYDKVEVVFNRMENNQAQNISDFKNTSDDGPLKIDYFYSGDRVREVFMDGLTELGYGWARDFNGDDRIGFTNSQGNLHRGIRQSPARAYLIPAAQRPNLHVVKFATVTNLIMSGNRVQGVNFLSGSKEYQARAIREVVLSAGAIGSPQILMASGIGPRKHLSDLEIEVVNDLPVGENLQDHVVVSMHFKFKEIDGEVSFSQTLDNIYAYFKNQTGPYSAPVSPDFNGFINSRRLVADHPDLQTQHIIFERNSPGLRRGLHLRRYQRKFIDQLVEINKEMTIAIVYMIVTNPKSVGRIQLRNKDPLSKPLIYPNYFSHLEDLETVMRGQKIYNLLVETKAFKKNGGEFIQFKDFECDDYPSNGFWECYSRYFSSTLYHPSGTTKMGPSTDHTAVVDPLLRVRGVEGLRVCDAGIQPNIVTVNINPVSIMIGERCAEFIKEWYDD